MRKVHPSWDLFRGCFLLRALSFWVPGGSDLRSTCRALKPNILHINRRHVPFSSQWGRDCGVWGMCFRSQGSWRLKARAGRHELLAVWGDWKNWLLGMLAWRGLLKLHGAPGRKYGHTKSKTSHSRLSVFLVRPHCQVFFGLSGLAPLDWEGQTPRTGSSIRRS